MRQEIIAGNWKMNGTKASVTALLRNLLNESKDDFDGVELIVFPPYVFLEQTEHALSATSIRWGGQNVDAHASGAYTGEISAGMLLDFGCRYVIVGHSERRHIYGESDADVAARFMAASKAGLCPILCVGEKLDERQAGQTDQVIKRQLDAVLNLAEGVQALKHAVIAYEPVWAIGTGQTATPEQAQEVHANIRQYLAKYDSDVAQRLRILYGGSLKANNAKALFLMPDIDGGLIGGASLDAREFLEIARSCKHSF